MKTRGNFSVRVRLWAGLAIIGVWGVWFAVRPRAEVPTPPLATETRELAAAESIRPTASPSARRVSSAPAEPIALPLTPLAAWAKPSDVPEFAAFQRWADAFVQRPAADRTTTDLAEGVALANARRAVLKQLIPLDPERVLANAVPEAVRRALPPEVAARLETRVDARGDLIVTGATPGEGALTARQAMETEAVIGGERFDAYTYGRRENQPTRWRVPIHGVALDGKLAVSEWPARVLEPVEVADARAAGANEVCAVSQVPVANTGTEVGLKVATRVELFCAPSHAAAQLAAAAETEALLPPGFGANTSAPIIEASDGVGLAVPSPNASGDVAWTTGSKRIVIVRAKFHGDYGNVDYTDLDSTNCEAIVTKMNDAWTRWSYGQCTLKAVGAGSFVTPVMTIEGSASSHSEDDIDGWWSDAEDWADANGVPRDSYDYLMLIIGNAPITDTDGNPPTWSGKGRVGGPYTILRTNDDTLANRIARNVSVGLHELGHNLGLRHSSCWYTTPKVVATVGAMTYYETFSEYGDNFDRMGHGAEDYNVRYKHWLRWLSDTEVPRAAGDGRFKIREHDLGERGGRRGLEVPFLPGVSGYDSLFVEYRLFRTDWAPLLHGATVRWLKSGGTKSYLLDGTPETLNDGSTLDDMGNWDSPLLPGRTLSFTKYGVPLHITTLWSDPDTGELEVQVNRGTPAGNHAPTGSIQMWSSGASSGQEVFFTASASDADGDELAYHWEVTDADWHWSGDPYANIPTIGGYWTGSGSRTVKCVVSDMHGGVTTLTKTLTVVLNTAPTISNIGAQVTDEDTPLQVFFSVNDATTPPEALNVAAISQDTSLLPASGLTIVPLGGGSRRLDITPAANKHGEVSIIVSVNDGFKVASREFKLTVRPVTPGTSLIAGGSTWRYWDSASFPGSGWQLPAFVAAAWPSSTARFVYNQGLFLLPGWTALADAPGRTTCYFRRSFTAPATPTGTLTLKLLCDDGAVVYLNGIEVWRQNLPDGTIGATTRALTSVEGTREGEFNLVPLDAALLHAGGTNVLAVEVHDVGGTSRGGGDVSFDASLALLQEPVVSVIPDQTMAEDTVLTPVNFTATDSETPGGPLEITATSSVQSLIADGDIVFKTAFPLQKYLQLTPQPNAIGNTTVTLRVSDGSSVTFRSFNVRVTSVNDAPTIDPVPDMASPVNEVPAPALLHVGDVDDDPATLVVTATSSNQAFLPNAKLTVLPGPSASERWLVLQPTAGVAAQANVTVTVSDGAKSSNDTFIFRVGNALGATSVPVTLVESGADWRYWTAALPLDARGNPIDFTDPALDDRAWPAGPSQLGYGGDGEKTNVGATPYRVTTYFRRAFTIPDPAALASLTLRLLRDDGAVVYLNGTQIASSNMPRGAVTATTLAAGDVSGTAEDTWFTFNLTTAALRAGRNVLAVEVHQSAMPSGFIPGDLSFDLELDGVPAAPASEDVFITAGDLWDFWDSADYPGDQWRDGSFPALDWSQGLARLGFGIGGESTVLVNGATGVRNPTVLLRKVFDVTDPSFYGALHLFLQRDDGVVVYLNGTRVLLDGVAANATFASYALAEVPAGEQTQWRHFLIDPKYLLRGRNLLAVELHQASATGLDLNFDAQLSAEVVDAPPPLFIKSVAAGFELAWPAPFDNWYLQTSTTLDAGSWTTVVQPAVSHDGWIYVTYPSGDAKRFFRLAKP